MLRLFSIVFFVNSLVYGMAAPAYEPDTVLARMPLVTVDNEWQLRERSFDDPTTASGTVGRDPYHVEQVLNAWRTRGRNLDEILDKILDTPVGYRTRESLGAEIKGVPLGVLCGLLKRRCFERYGNFSAYNHLLYQGRVWKLKNVVTVLPAIPNPYNHQEGSMYTPKRVDQEVFWYEFICLPLHKVEPTIPIVLSPYDLDNEEGGGPLSVEEYVNIYTTPTTLSEPDEPMMTLEEYVERITSKIGGSDVSFYTLSAGGSFAKRFNVTPTFWIENKGTFRARSLRSAGLRQVLLEDYETDLNFGQKPLYSFRLFVPGGLRNCFISSIRWSFLKQHLDDYLTAISCKIESAQDTDMLVTEEIIPFDEVSVLRSIDSMIDEVFRVRIRSKENQTMGDYLKHYRNGFPTVELREIAKLFYEKFKILISYFRIDRHGRWENMLSLPIQSLFFERQIILFQLNDMGKLLDLKKATAKYEESIVSNDLTDGSLGSMTHVCTIHPLPVFFFSPLSHLYRSARQSFKKEVNSILSPYFQSIYEKLKYDKDIDYQKLFDLVRYQLFRYNSKETKTLIFDLSTSSSLRESKRLKFGGVDGSGQHQRQSMNRREFLKKLNERENPRVWVYAYDLETVDNVKSCQEMVYPPFRKEIDPGSVLNVEDYDPMESQIPFSAQYVGVNIADDGNFKARKCSAGIKLLEYPHQHIGGIFITPNATTVYGENNYLGECIEEFLCRIACEVHAFAGEQVYLYACNGSKFDSYVVLQFQRFEISHILKTSRGILSVSLRVPVSKPPLGQPYDYRIDHTPKVTLILRDVSLLVPGSLSRLCKGFNVPAELCKQDFPIQMVNYRNCYHPRIMGICRDYGEKDVLALGFILKAINCLIGNSHWNPCEIHSDRPPICQFLTCMGMIRKSTKEHFDGIIPASLQPKAIDIPALRTWIIQSAIGGRVTAYAKTYVSPLFGDILDAALSGNRFELEQLHSIMLREGKCMQCLDFTSLYPYVMDSCPLPMGGLHAIDAETCDNYIKRMHCDECDKLRRLCSTHRYLYSINDRLDTIRPFAIILVKNIHLQRNHSHPFQNLCPRKTYHGKSGKNISLLYSLENKEDFEKREEGSHEVLRDPQAYTNIDLYWMRRQGYTFDIIGGISFSCLSTYNTFIGPAFKMRIEAKKAGNRLLSDFMKLNYNGSYGITIQQDITDSYFLAHIPEEFRYIDPLEPPVRNAVYASMRNKAGNNDGFNCSEELTGEAFYFPSGQSCFQKRKKDHLAEYYSDQSPLQVGSAILAYARHVGNLVLFNMDPFDYTYTDTDSFTLGENVIQQDIHLRENICNRDDAPMGSLKNDHEENNGTEPRIFFSMIGGKKVKCHFTLNAEGNICIFNTFKGLHVSCDLDGKKINPTYAEYLVTKTLLDVNVHNTTEHPVIVQSWKRDLQNGVSIGNHLQVLDTNTYMSDHKGIKVISRSHGLLEYFVPHGSSLPSQEIDYRIIPPPPKDPSNQPPIYHPARPVPYQENLEKLRQFIELYYKGSDQEYNPGTEEYNEILHLFRSIEEEGEKE